MCVDERVVVEEYDLVNAVVRVDDAHAQCGSVYVGEGGEAEEGRLREWRVMTQPWESYGAIGLSYNRFRRMSIYYSHSVSLCVLSSLRITHHSSFTIILLLSSTLVNQ